MPVSSRPIMNSEFKNLFLCHFCVRMFCGQWWPMFWYHHHSPKGQPSTSQGCFCFFFSWLWIWPLSLRLPLWGQTSVQLYQRALTLTGYVRVSHHTLECLWSSDAGPRLCFFFFFFPSKSQMNKCFKITYDFMFLYPFPIRKQVMFLFTLEA